MALTLTAGLILGSGLQTTILMDRSVMFEWLAVIQETFAKLCKERLLSLVDGRLLADARNALEVGDLAVRFGSTAVIENLSFRVARGTTLPVQISRKVTTASCSRLPVPSPIWWRRRLRLHKAHAQAEIQTEHRGRANLDLVQTCASGTASVLPIGSNG